MAIYQILTTPGKEVVYPLKSGDTRFGNELEEDDTIPKNQDEAKVVLARLRAEARAADEKVDFVIQRAIDAEGGARTSSSTGTSIRLSEENRRTVAKFCGRMMMETGDPITMGDAVGRLVAIAETASETGLIEFDGSLNEDEVIALAKRLVKERKEAGKG